MICYLAAICWGIAGLLMIVAGRSWLSAKRKIAIGLCTLGAIILMVIAINS